MVLNKEERMRLGKYEFLAMNNHFRRLLQKYHEMRIFRNMLNREGVDLRNLEIFDAGCGSGYSTELILNTFKPSKIIAIDYMPEQIALAKKRGLAVDFAVGDIRRTDFPAESFDAAFIFGVLHHIPDWNTALGEMFRILKKNGHLLVEEPMHTFTDNIYSERLFEKGLNDAGFSILQKRSVIPFYFQSYLCQRQ